MKNLLIFLLFLAIFSLKFPALAVETEVEAELTSEFDFEDDFDFEEDFEVDFDLEGDFNFEAEVDKDGRKDRVGNDRFHSPWQPTSLTKKAQRNWKNNQPNRNDSNFNWFQRTRLYYKLKAKKAMKESNYSQAKAATKRPKNQKGYEKKYYADQKAVGVDVKKNRRKQK